MSDQVPPPPPPQQSEPLRGTDTPPPARRRAGRGCLIAVLILVVLLVGIGLAITAGIVWLADKAEDVIGSTGPCPYLTDEQASEAVGVPAEAELFTGGLGRLINVVDMRVLPDKESCIIQQRFDSVDHLSVPGLGRTVKHVGSDAGTLYEQELTKATGTAEDRGNGITVESQSYFNRDVPGLGDRAFCITSTGTVAGVLAIEGDTLVYVGVTRAGAVPGVDLGDPGNPELSTDDAACEASVALARDILAG